MRLVARLRALKRFREGGFFEKGDVLLKLDDRDHQAEVKSAQANLLTAEQSLLEEKARGQQALTDWTSYKLNDNVRLEATASYGHEEGDATGPSEGGVWYWLG